MRKTHCEHMFTRSLSVVEGGRPRIYELVLESCSEPVVVDGILLLSDVETVPLWLPVGLLELLVFMGEAAFSSLWLLPYCNKKIIRIEEYSLLESKSIYSLLESKSIRFIRIKDNIY